MKKIISIFLCTLTAFNTQFMVFAEQVEKSPDVVIGQEAQVTNVSPVDIPVQIVPDVPVQFPEAPAIPDLAVEENKLPAPEEKQNQVDEGVQEKSPDGGEEEKNQENNQLAQAAAAQASSSNFIANHAPNSPIKDALPKTDGANGALVYSYPFSLPAGRNGMTPSLALQYNSQGLQDSSIVGYGWSLNIPSITRVNKNGIEKFYSANAADWSFSSSIDGELIQAGVAGTVYTFMARIDGGSYNIYTYDSVTQIWTMKTKNGQIFSFGTSATSRQNNPTNAAQTYSWMIDKQIDANNNFISYTYTKDSGQIYPLKISYTGNGATAGIFAVNFITEARTDIMPSYRTNFGVTSNYRIKTITTQINSTIVSKFDLRYISGVNTKRSLLAGITLTGYDSNNAATSYPETKFSYENSVDVNKWARIDFAPSTPLVNYGQSQYADVNGDGMQDIVRSWLDPNGNIGDKSVYINNGNNSYTKSTTFIPPIYLANYGFGTSSGHTFLGDVNGDGKADIIFGYPQADVWSAITPKTYINNGTNWVYDPTWTYPVLEQTIDSGQFQNIDAWMAMPKLDLNGDGLVDMAINRYFIGQPATTLIFLNTGHGWVKNTDIPWKLPSTIVSTSGSTLTSDINNDGFLDYLSSSTMWLPGGQPCAVYKSSTLSKGITNNGVGVEAPQFLPPTIFQGDYSFSYGCGPGNRGISINDLNNDGLADIAQYTWSAFADIQSSAYINTGAGWLQDSTQKVPETIAAGDYSDAAYFIDLNNDGLLDFVPVGATYYYKNTAKQKDRMISVISSLGSVTSIEYKVSSEYKDISGNRLNAQFPFPISTVSKITTTEPVTGNILTKNYTYSGGYFYYNSASPLDRKFAGFAKVVETDGTGDISETYFHQGNATDTSNGEYADSYEKMGKPYRSVQKNSSGQIFAQAFTRWNATPISGAAGAFFVYPSQTLAQSWDGTGSHRDVATTYSYDNYGNQSSVKNWGEVSGNADGSFTDISDKIITVNTFYASTLVGLPCLTQVFDGANNKLSETRIYYDNLVSCQPTKGNPTRQENWLKESASFVSSSMTYNTYGQILSTTDPRRNSTTVAYDGYSLYPTTTTNALLQTTQTQYDPKNGQLLQVTDVNGGKIRNTYDGLGRLTKTEITDPAIPANMKILSTISYNDTARPIQVLKKTFDGAGNVGVEEIGYYDGFGNVIQNRRTAEGANQYSVKSQTYDQKNRLKTEYLPVFQSGSGYTSPTGQTNSYQYDSLDRVTSISNVLGTSTISYSPWRKESIDPNGHRKGYSQDAFGNLVLVEEVNNSNTYVTNYSYDSSNRLSNITDAEGFVRNFTYDSLGRLLSQELPHVSSSPASMFSYGYDLAGNLTRKTDPKNQTTTYTYDPLNRVTNEDYSGKLPLHLVYTYDSGAYAKGKLTSVVSSADGVSTAYSYDILGRALSQTQTVGTVAQSQSQSYDILGNVLTKNYPNGVAVNYTYDNAYQLATIKYGTNALVNNIDYAPTGGVSRMDYANGTSTINTYDPNKMYRLVNKKTTKGTAVYQDISYVFDAVGNVITLTENANNENKRTVNYTYDYLDRLLTATYSNLPSGQVVPAQTYTYSPTGNIFSRGSNIYTYTNPRMPQAVTNITTSPSQKNFTYDNNGNRVTQSIQGGSTSMYAYDSRDRMIYSGAMKSPQINYVYDENNARVKKWNKATSALSLYFGDYEVETKADGSGVPIATDPARINRVNINIGGTQIATLEYSATNNTVPTNTSYHHTDHLTGSSVETDATGASNQALDYLPFGSVRVNAKTGTHDNKHKFTGKELDPESNLMYYGARYYDQEVGRFTGVDPMILGLPQIYLEQPQNLNPYTYALNNPLKYIDPTGMYVYQVVANPNYNIIGAKVGTLISGNTSIDVYGNGGTYKFSWENRRKECVALAQSIYRVFYGVNFGQVEYAKNIYTLVNESVVTEEGKILAPFNERASVIESGGRFVRYENGSLPKLQEGDMVIYAASKVNKYGHVAVVSEVFYDSVLLVEQNGSNMSITETVSRGDYMIKTDSGYLLSNSNGSEVLGIVRYVTNQPEESDDEDKKNAPLSTSN